MLSERSHLFILILVLLCGSLPFIHQAFHIDDRIYLEIADNILEKPLFPYDYPLVFEGIPTPDMASHSHLPLTSYYIALVKALTGSESEWIYHLAFLFFPLVAAVGFYDLAEGYLCFQLPAVCLLMVSPAFFVLSHTLMPDVPLLAFWILSLSRFLRICEDRAGVWDWALCALGLLAASFLSLVSAGLIVLMAAYWLIHVEEGQKSSQLWPVFCLLSLPVLLWLFWYLRAYLYYDRFVLTSTFLHMSKRDAFSWDVVGIKGLSFILNLGGTFLFPIALWGVLVNRIRVRVLLLVSFMSIVPFFVWFAGWTWSHMLLFALFLSSGLLVLWRFWSLIYELVFQVIRDVALSGFRQLSLSWGELRSTDESQADSLENQSSQAGEWGSKRIRNYELLLVFWFLGSILTALVVFYSGSVRYSLLALPPVILVCVKALESRIRNSYFLRNLIWTLVVVTAGYSAAIAYGDYRFAQVYPLNLKTITSEYAQPGRIVWFTGEWGYRYYFERAGGQILSRTSANPEKGDIIVKPRLATPWNTLYDGPEFSEFLERRLIRLDYPLRILDYSSHAGFYSTGWGILPFSVTSGEPVESFDIFRVVKKYDGPIPEPESHF